MGSIDSSDPIAKTFGRILREMRTGPEINLTQDQLAERAGFSSRYIRQLESGRRRASLSAFMALADALGTTATSLMGKLESTLER